MKRPILFLAGAAMLLAASPAAAADWRLVNRSDRGEDYIDAGEVTRRGDRVNFQHRIRYSAPQTDEGGTYNMMTVHLRASCSDRSFRVVRMVSSTDGRNEDGWNANMDNPPAPEGSLMAQFIAMACTGQYRMIGEERPPPAT